ncbi:MAG: formylmethanofuran dehydrogenase subunit C [Planctomycetota bacterium]|nr:MAG: formylmethanofuran dehydrogenase subunit C [Planctomycetota bacterium]
MPITFHLKRQPTVPLEAEVLSPDAVGELSNAEIRALTVYHGKRQLPLGEFFDVDGERSTDLVLRGDLSKVRWIGRAMTKGTIAVHGSVGMHLGAYMSGGKIEVHGDAGDWVGAEMKNGAIRVHGNAGGQVGAAYRGSMAGMKNGTILIDGSAGLEVGMRMRRGLIVVGGPARDFTGLQMKGGTILLLSGAEIRTGAWMVRGTIISLKPLALMPTFVHNCTLTPPFVSVYAKHLKHFNVALPYAADEGVYEMHAGDLSVSDKGEILVWRPAC